MTDQQHTPDAAPSSVPAVVGVLGGGRMGGGIAHAFLVSGSSEVVVVERDPRSAEAARERIEADLERIVAHEVPLVITSLGAAKEVVDAVHSYGGLVFHDVTNAKHAAKAAAAGVDGLILVSAGAGRGMPALVPAPSVPEPASTSRPRVWNQSRMLWRVEAWASASRK